MTAGPRGPHQGCYYNDSDPFVCAWLKNLIAAGLIPAGDVDVRPIQEVSPDDVRGYPQAHFFAGIGGWAYALQLAGWGEHPLWTGSCPCQPFSAAGQRRGTSDARHLWPAWAELIRECRPPTVFGEQVASPAGIGWFDAVARDLEAMGYAVGAADLSAASVGAPHLRQRLWFVADAADGDGRRGECCAKAGTLQDGERGERSTSGRAAGVMADADGGESGDGDLQRSGEYRQRAQDGGARELADARRLSGEPDGFDVGATAGDRRGAPWKQRLWPDPWASGEFVPCRDGKARPVEPGTFPLAHGIPGRVGRLRAYGNAIVPQVAAAFVSAYLECRP